jgi:hypothetical protein
MDGGIPRARAGESPAPPGRRWLALAALLLVVSIGSWLYLVVALGIEGGSCFDVQRDPQTQPRCDRAHVRVAQAWQIIILVAAASAVLMALIGLLEGLQRRRFASGARQPLRVLVAVNPAAMLGYLLGHVAGKLLPPLTGPRPDTTRQVA